MSVSTTKLRFLYIMKTLLEQTDEEHVMSAADLEEALGGYGLTVERKSIYNDIETLEAFGLDIVQVRGGKKPGYYIASREFELPELKLLVDAVQASKFITARKSRELIAKLEKLAGRNGAGQLQRDVFIASRVKTENETIYNNVDQIHAAMLGDRRIRFQYTEWSTSKRLVVKRGGEFYEVSPWMLTWDDENYYMIAYEESSDLIKHYRVDKMRKTIVTDESRQGRERFAGFDPASYTRKTFGMYGGREETVRLLCKNSAIGVIIDRFSREIIVAPADETHSRVNVDVYVSPQFFGWLSGLGGDVIIEGPASVRSEYRDFLQKIANEYNS